MVPNNQQQRGSSSMMMIICVVVCMMAMVSSVHCANPLNGRLVLQSSSFSGSTYPVLSINASTGAITYLNQVNGGNHLRSSVAVDPNTGLYFALTVAGRIQIVNITGEGNGTLIGEVQPPSDYSYATYGIQLDGSSTSDPSLIVVVKTASFSTHLVGGITVSSLFASLSTGAKWNMTTIASFNTSETGGDYYVTSIDTVNRMYYLMMSAGSTASRLFGVNIDTRVVSAYVTVAHPVDASTWSYQSGCILAYFTDTGAIGCINPATGTSTTVVTSVPNWSSAYSDCFVATNDGNTKGTLFVVSINTSGSVPDAYIFAYDIATGTKIKEYPVPAYPYRLVYLSSPSSSSIDSSSSSTASDVDDGSAAGLSSIPSLITIAATMIAGAVIGM